jgi:hypothetical protein
MTNFNELSVVEKIKMERRKSLADASGNSKTIPENRACNEGHDSLKEAKAAGDHGGSENIGSLIQGMSNLNTSVRELSECVHRMENLMQRSLELTSQQNHMYQNSSQFSVSGTSSQNPGFGQASLSPVGLHQSIEKENGDCGNQENQVKRLNTKTTPTGSPVTSPVRKRVCNSNGLAHRASSVTEAERNVIFSYDGSRPSYQEEKTDDVSSMDIRHSTDSICARGTPNERLPPKKDVLTIQIDLQNRPGRWNSEMVKSMLIDLEDFLKKNGRKCYQCFKDIEKGTSSKTCATCRDPYERFPCFFCDSINPDQHDSSVCILKKYLAGSCGSCWLPYSFDDVKLHETFDSTRKCQNFPVRLYWLNKVYQDTEWEKEHELALQPLGTGRKKFCRGIEWFFNQMKSEKRLQ